MLVVCGRCETEYDFDDALLSERGTTVKCTNCGYQFRVKPQRGVVAPLGERWVVRHAGGAEQVFASLRDLRKAIDERELGLDDELSRDGGPFRRFRDVAELSALFRRQHPPIPHGQTLVGVGVANEVREAGTPQQEPAPSPHTVKTPVAPSPVARRTNPSLRPSSVPRPKTATPASNQPVYESFSSEDRKSASFSSFRPPAPAQVPQELASTLASAPAPSPRAPSPPLPTSRAPSPPVPSPPAASIPAAAPVVVAAVVPRPPALPNTQTSAPAPPVEYASAPAAAVDTPRTRSDRPGVPNTPSSPSSMAPPAAMAAPARKSGGLRWVVGFVLLGGLGLLAGTVGKDYLSQFVGSGDTASNTEVAGLLAAGWELFRDGDVAAARERFERGVARAPQDPNVLMGLAQLEAVQGDFAWLRLRLLPEDASAERAKSQEALTRHLAAFDLASKRLEGIAAAAERRALIETDGLRLRGDSARAREIVARSSFDATDPHVAYVLAMLDLAEASPAMATVIERLKTALVSERGLGRARSALVYALALSGDFTAARSELGRLDAERPHPLSDPLKDFLERREQQTLEPRSEEPAAEVVAAEAEAPRPGEAAGGGSPLWLWLDQASAARRSGDLAGATANYQKVLKSDPKNAAALSGLGALARLQGRNAEAKDYFDQVLERSPNHVASLVGGADVRWILGAKESAVLLYKKIPAGSTFHDHARRRIAEFEGRAGESPSGSEDPPTAKDAPAASPAEPAPVADAPTAPNVEAPKAAPPAEPAPPEAE